MTWYKDGSKLEENGCTLKITNAKMNDQGLYSCIATNDLGQHKCSAKLLVAGKGNISYIFLGFFLVSGRYKSSLFAGGSLFACESSKPGKYAVAILDE